MTTENEEVTSEKGIVIRLLSGMRYQKVGDDLYSLNWGERGMCGVSMGKIIPVEIANDILDEYNCQQGIKSRKPLNAVRPKKSRGRKAKKSSVQLLKDSKGAPLKSGTVKRKGKSSAGTSTPKKSGRPSISLGGLIKKS